MTGHSKWEEFNNSAYDDDELDERRNLDYCRLYITNIPKALNEDGLRAAFERFGTLKEIFFSKDPQKKYAIVRYETSSEAKLAMMKMNRTEPLRLCIAIAKKNKRSERKDTRQTEPKYDVYDDNRYDSASFSNRSRNIRREDASNGGSVVEDNFPLEDTILTEPLDSSLDLKLESLKLEQLKLREEQLKLREEQLQCKHRILVVQQAEVAEKRQAPASSNRCILPDGRIVVRNVNERVLEGRDGDVGHSAGAGDSTQLKIPGLQRGMSACVACGRRAEAFCAACTVTPYCSESCQRRDWTERHKSVCHNLARLTVGSSVVNNEEEIPSSLNGASPRQANSSTTLTKRDAARRDDPEPDRRNKNLMPSECKAPLMSGPGFRPGARDSQEGAAPPRRNQDTRRPPNRQTHKDQPNGDHGNTNKFPKQQQHRPLPKMQNNEQQRPTPRAASMMSSPRSEKSEDTVKQSPSNAEQQPPKHSTHPLLDMKHSQMKEISIAEAKTTPPSTNNVAPVPARVLVPKTYLIEELNIGDVILLSAESEASQCRTKQPGIVCLSMHEKFGSDFDRLCGDYAVDCEAETDHRPKPGDMFSFLNPEDEGWYRARGLTPTLAALIDSCKLVSLTPTDKCKKLPSKYADIPEFCCLLDANNIKVGASLKCILLSKTTDGFKVSLEDVDSGAQLGEGIAKRWLPEIEYPVAANAGIPEVSRPVLVHGSRVLLVDATAPDRVVLRPADLDSQKQFDAVLQDVLLYGINGSSLTEPPSKGQTVIGRYTDGLHYRALCRRTNVKQDKYQLEYLEYGNIEVSKLETLYPCPKYLDTDMVPTLASVASLGLDITGFTPSAEQYLEVVKDEEMILRIPNGAKSAPSGSAVTLTLTKNNEVLNRKVQELCTPDWKKIEDRGGNVLETECLMYQELEYCTLPAGGCTLEVLDDSMLCHGTVSGCEVGLHHAHHVFTKLTQRIGEYCNSELGRDPYLPRPEELCIAQYPPTGEWCRGVLLEQAGGPGADSAQVLYVDYGRVQTLPVALVRKMLPEFVRGLPAVATHLEITDFPKNPTADMLEKARRYMKMTAAGRGQLTVTRCEIQDEKGFYTVHAPDLIKVMCSA